MTEITTVGLDLAKNVFQVHCADDHGACVLRRRLRRGQLLGFFADLDPCLVAMDYGDSAFYSKEYCGALVAKSGLSPNFVTEF